MRSVGSRLVESASWALVGALFCAPLLLGKLAPQPDLWAHVALCAILLLALVGAVLAGKPRLRVGRADLPWLALLVAYLVASFVTVYPRGTLVELMRLLDYLLLYLLVRLLLREYRMLVAGAIAFACGGAVAAVLGLREYIPTALAGDPSWRVFGPFYNPNILAAALLMAIPMWIALLRISRLPVMRMACGVGLIVCWLCFFVTGSKGGALALLSALIAGAIVAPDPGKPHLARRALLGVGAVLLAGALALLLPPIRVRIAEALGPQANSMMFRYYTWVGTWHMALARPILGFGPGTFAAGYPRFAIVGHTSLAHQTYLQVAAETGVVGAAAFIALLATQLVSAFRAARRLAGDARTLAAAAAAGMVGFCLHNVVDYSWHVTATGMAFWALAGLVAGARAVDRAPGVQRASGNQRRKRVGDGQEAAPVRWSRVAAAAALCLGAMMPAVFALGAARLARQGDLRGACRLDPLNETYHQQLAFLAHGAARSGREELYAAAFAEWREVQRLRPTYPGTPYNRARMYAELGHYAQARAQFAEAERLAPTWPKALVAHAELLERIGEDDEALRLYRRVDELSDSPLFHYRGVANDLDPGFARAWLAIADSAPPDEAQRRYVETARYLRRLLDANRGMEAVWRQSGAWEQRQGPELVELCEEVARRQVVFEEPGARLRGALLLVDAGLTRLAEELFVTPGEGITGADTFGRIIGGWSSFVSGAHLRAQGRFEAGDALIRAAAEKLAEPLGDGTVVRELQEGEYRLSDPELNGLRRPIRVAEDLGPPTVADQSGAP